MKSTIIKIAAIFLFSPFSQAQTQSDEWNLVANSQDNYYGVAMANGQIGIVTDATPLKTKEIILNGVYDGSPENGISRIVRGIEFLNLRLVINGEEVTASNIDKWEQVVAMKEGTSTTSFRFKDIAAIEYTILANRALPFSAMAIVKITPLKDIEMTAANYMTVPEELKQAKRQFRVLKDNQYLMPVFGTTAQTLTGKYKVAASTTFLFDGTSETLEPKGDEVGFTKKLSKGKVYRFAIAGGFTAADPAGPYTFAPADMTKVVTHVDAINSSLAPDYWDNFKPENNTSPEILFSSKNTRGGQGGGIQSRWRMSMHYQQTPDGWNGFATVAEYYNKFNPNVSRHPRATQNANDKHKKKYKKEKSFANAKPFLF